MFYYLYIQAILTGLGLQHKTVDTLTQELELPANQLLALFNRSMRKLAGSIAEKRVLESLSKQKLYFLLVT
jgi:N-acetyltransferase 10